MPRPLDDEVEYNDDRRPIKEKPQRDPQEHDEIAVYGSEDDDVVTGDEMEADGSLDQEAGMDDPEAGLDDVDFDEGEMSDDDLGDFEDDENPDSLDDEGDFEDDMGDDVGGELDVEAKADIFDQLADVLSKIADSKGEPIEDMDDAQLEEAVNMLFLSEHNTDLRNTTNRFAESTEYEATDIYDIVEAIKHADSSKEVIVDPSSIQENGHYHSQKVTYKDTTIITVIEQVAADQVDVAKTDAERSNQSWNAFKRNYLETLEDPEAQFGGENPKETERQYVQEITRKQAVIPGSKIIEYIKESQNDTRLYVFSVDDYLDQLGEQLNGSKHMPKLNEDTKKLSQKTRKTHDTKIATMPYLYDKMLASVLDTQFKGSIKPFSKIASDLKKADQKGGHSGQAKARRGDKRNSDARQSVKEAKVEAAKALVALVSEMTGPQVSALLKSFQKDAKPSDLIKESASDDFSTEMDALRTLNEELGLSEQALKDLDLVIETAIRSRVDDAARQLDIHYANKHRNAVDQTQRNLTKRLDEYLDYVADQFMADNRLTIETGLRGEITESLLDNVFRVFKEHNVDVPEGRTNLLEEANQKKLQEAQRAEKSAQTALAYKRKAVHWMKQAVISEAVNGLTVKDANMIRSKAEMIKEFADEKDFAHKVATLKRAYVKRKISENTDSLISNENDLLLESEEIDTHNGNALMDRYVNTTKGMSQH